MNHQTNNWQLTEHFNLAEFAEPHTGAVKIHPVLVHKLEQIRKLFAFPITITSGYRSIEHNALVGGVPTSKHIMGAAVDVSVPQLLWDDLVKHARDLGGLTVLDEGDHIHLSLTDHEAYEPAPEIPDAGAGDSEPATATAHPSPTAEPHYRPLT